MFKYLSNLSILILVILLTPSCKKEAFENCIDGYADSEYMGYINCDETIFTFDDVIINTQILNNEMAIWVNGFSNEPFEVTVSDDCSFTINSKAESPFIILPNQDSLFVDGGSGMQVQDSIEIMLNTNYSDNCFLRLGTK